MRKFQQRLESWIHGTLQRIQPKLCENPILTSERNRIRDGGDGDHLHEGHQEPRVVLRVQSSLHQRLRQLEGDTGSAQIFAGILASGLVGI